LAFKEQKTSDLVKRQLSEAGIEYVGGLAGGTGVLARLPATTSGGSTVALRADMDALPILEETGLPYKSSNEGVMHACGHDGHTTILLSAAKLLSQTDHRENEVLFIFQPAEENGGGGKKMRDEGVLTGAILGKPADTIFGLHGFPSVEIGRVSTRVGPLLASACQLKITIKGKGAHAAQPHKGIDPILVASHIVTALQTVSSRSVDPLDSVVVTIGKIEAGHAHNVIPDTAILSGTLRTLSDEVSSLATGRIERIVSSIAEAFDATAQVEWEAVPYPVTRNDKGATERFRKIARSVVGADCVLEEPNPSMGGEDFSFYGQQVPACFFFLGLRPSEQETYPNLHSPTFDFNDNALQLGIELMTNLALAKF
jgi:amidohydrolase